MVEVWEAEREAMSELVERLADVDDEQWNSPSLCAEWRIRDALAHVTAGAEGAFGALDDLDGEGMTTLVARR